MSFKAVGNDLMLNSSKGEIQSRNVLRETHKVNQFFSLNRKERWSFYHLSEFVW